MGFKRFVKKGVKNNLNVSSWIDWGTLKRNTHIIGQVVSDVKEMSEPDAPLKADESFEEAMARFGITEEQLKANMRTELFGSIFASVLGVIALGWAVYLFVFLSMYLSGLVSLALSLLMLVYGFKLSFSYCHAKKRQVRITLSAWFKWLLGLEETRS